MAYAKHKVPILPMSLGVKQLCQLAAYFYEHGHLFQVFAIPPVEGFQER